MSRDTFRCAVGAAILAGMIAAPIVAAESGGADDERGRSLTSMLLGAAPFGGRPLNIRADRRHGGLSSHVRRLMPPGKRDSAANQVCERVSYPKFLVQVDFSCE